MKWIILFLVVVNLAFFAWNYQKVPWRHHATANALDNGDDVPRLRLLDEPAASHARGGLSTTGGAQCATLGPFEKRAQAAAAAQRLHGMDLTARVRVEHLPDEGGFWVLIPPAKTHAAARKTIDRLRAKGVKDYFLVAAGDMKNAISLGVFSSDSAARQRLANIRKLGFAPQLQGVPLPQRRYWLDLAANAKPDDAERALKALLSDYPHLGRTRHACESP